MKFPTRHAAALAAVLLSSAAWAESQDESLTAYHTLEVEGVSIFYREAGRKDAPTLLLLHGFPSSSHMFRDLIPKLAETYHVIAPDYPGFGQSSAPDAAAYDYDFATLAQTIDAFTQEIGLTAYTLYMQDYGGPVGLRLAVEHPDRADFSERHHPRRRVEPRNRRAVCAFLVGSHRRNGATPPCPVEGRGHAMAIRARFKSLGSSEPGCMDPRPGRAGPPWQR